MNPRLINAEKIRSSCGGWRIQLGAHGIALDSFAKLGRGTIAGDKPVREKEMDI
jgi:hypothetical protein